MNGQVSVVPKASKSILSNQRKYLTMSEVARLIGVAKENKAFGHRNATMILLAFRHGLRVSELISLQWHQIDLKTGTVACHRLKNGIPSVHPLTGVELRALKRLRRDNPDSRFVFLSQRGQSMTRQNFWTMLTKLGVETQIEVPTHPHMLRHATGYKLANEGKDTRSLQHYMGHRNIQSTVIYTDMDANRFNQWWKD
jgi:type 1 fimbriae regulatory protein FimB/type 1 fimbriae regulatory protein FimE